MGRLGLVALLAVLLLMGAAAMVGFRVTRPLRSLNRAKLAPAGHDIDQSVSGAGRQDEVGEMAGAADVSKQGLVHKRVLETEAARTRETTGVQRRRLMHARPRGSGSWCARSTPRSAARRGWRIQHTTGQAVAAIQGLSLTIGQIDDMTGGIAAAVDEQGAADGETALAVRPAAGGPGGRRPSRPCPGCGLRAVGAGRPPQDRGAGLAEER